MAVEEAVMPKKTRAKINQVRVTIPVYIQAEPTEWYCPNGIDWKGNIIFTRKRGTHEVRITVDPVSMSPKELRELLSSIMKRINLANQPPSKKIQLHNYVIKASDHIDIQLWTRASFSVLIEACYRAFAYNSSYPDMVFNLGITSRGCTGWKPGVPQFENLLPNGLTIGEDIVDRYKETIVTV